MGLVQNSPFTACRHQDLSPGEGIQHPWCLWGRSPGTCRVMRWWRWAVVLPFLLLDICAQCRLPEPYVPSRCHPQCSTTLLLTTPWARRGEGCVSGAERAEQLLTAERTAPPRFLPFAVPLLAG